MLTPRSPKGFEEEVLVKDFTTNVETSGGGKLGGDGEVGKAEVSANADTVDGVASPVSMVTKKVNIRTVRTRFSGRYASVCSQENVGVSAEAHCVLPVGFQRKISKDKVEMLRLRDRDKLMFVHQTVYNTGPVKLIRKTKRDGSISASCQKMLHLVVKVSVCQRENPPFYFVLVVPQISVVLTLKRYQELNSEKNV